MADQVPYKEWVSVVFDPDAARAAGLAGRMSFATWEKLNDPTIKRRPGAWVANKRHRTSHTEANAPQLSTSAFNAIPLQAFGSTRTTRVRRRARAVASRPPNYTRPCRRRAAPWGLTPTCTALEDRLVSAPHVSRRLSRRA